MTRPHDTLTVDWYFTSQHALDSFVNNLTERGFRQVTTTPRQALQPATFRIYSTHIAWAERQTPDDPEKEFLL